MKFLLKERDKQGDGNIFRLRPVELVSTKCDKEREGVKGDLSYRRNNKKFTRFNPYKVPKT